MIVITIELWPHGDSAKARILGRGSISNTGLGSHKLGSYRAFFHSMGPGDPQTRYASVSRFKRLEKGPWELTYLVLKQIFGKKR